MGFNREKSAYEVRNIWEQLISYFEFGLACALRFVLHDCTVAQQAHKTLIITQATYILIAVKIIDTFCKRNTIS